MDAVSYSAMIHVGLDPVYTHTYVHADLSVWDDHAIFFITITKGQEELIYENTSMFYIWTISGLVS